MVDTHHRLRADASALGVPHPRTGWRDVAAYAPLVLQVALAAWVVHLFSIENALFARLFTLAAAGFVVTLALPQRMRLPFFVLLSLAGLILTLGLADAAWLLGVGATLIALCHLPAPFAVRVALLAACGAGLAAARAGVVGVPWSASVWPVLGSMFMFRLALYLLALGAGVRDDAGRGGLRAAAYFFMLPNLAFPLFPVVDYQTFTRTYYDKAPVRIYEQGIVWIARGLVHLLVYRLVYQRWLSDPADVATLGDLVQYMVGTFLLYLRVSGQFHLIVGMLHLFGFRLPETHKLYYLSRSFTDLWRRINIYWTEFMMKAVFYPTYFRVKRLGPTRALVVSTIVVFVTTWLLHAYQWFWLRGGFPITVPDTLFWALLGAFVVIGGVRELEAGRARSVTRGGWNPRHALQAATTFTIFCFLWSLWSSQSLTQWLWMLGAGAQVDLRGVLLFAAVFATIAAFGGWDWQAAGTATREGAVVGAAWQRVWPRPEVRSLATLLVLVVVGQDAFRSAVPAEWAPTLSALHASGLNATDAALQHRGYYEQLDVRGQPATQMAVAEGLRPPGWQDLAGLGMIRDRPDAMVRDLFPSRRVVWNGHAFSTNRWGMRDREYTRDKPADTFRIAFMGPSHVMGNNVGDGETFESLVEERLNREAAATGGPRYEILNFAVDGHSILQQVAMLEDRAFDFAPDLVIVTHHTSNRTMTEGALQKIVWGGFAVPATLRPLVHGAGLGGMDTGDVPIPFAGLRTVARRFGISPRMPHEESVARVRSIVDPTIRWSFAEAAAVGARHGVPVVVLALTTVLDEAPTEVPYAGEIARLGMPILNLFDVYPAAMRPQLRVAPWDDHPNVQGHRVIADRFFGELTRLLTRAGAGASGARRGEQGRESR